MFFEALSRVIALYCFFLYLSSFGDALNRGLKNTLLTKTVDEISFKEEIVLLAFMM